MNTIRTMVQDGTLTRATLVWKTGMNDWQAANTIPEIMSLFPGTPPPVPTREYQVGDTGPAGGIVFYDRGFREDGWRYLEAAPASMEYEGEWGVRGTNISGTSTEVGSGKKNTQILSASLSNQAAQICARMNIRGFTDWFLPSRDELYYMYRNLASRGLGSFDKGYYWSSSQDINGYAWCHDFKDGRQYGGNYGSKNKDDTLLVRAIRAF
jgi:hypothetical protein